MKMSKPLFFVFFLIINSLSIIGQSTDRSFNCGSEEARQLSLQDDPSYEQQAKDFEKKYVKYIESQAYLQASETVYTLPTVVHIIHAGAALGTTANPTDVSIASVVNEATDRFRHRHEENLSFGNPFSGVDTNIEFCLATTDPAGNYSTGVVRHYEPSLSVGPYTQLYDFIADTKWDDSKYCNMYIMTQMTNASGVYLGSVDVTVYTSTGFWSGLIAHEVGHYLNLRHTFNGGCKNDNCLEDGDAVCDTPPKATSGRGSNTCMEPGNSCTTDVDDENERNPYRASAMGDQPDILENYMDYTGSCWDAFTEGQKIRMRLLIEEHLLPLNTHASTACASRAKPANEIGVSSFEVATSDCESTAIVNTIMVNNFGSSPVTNFSIEIVLNDVVINTIAQTKSIEPGAQITLTIEQSLSLQDGNNNIQVRSKNPNGNTDGYTNNDISYGSAYFQTNPTKAPYQEAFSSTAWPNGFTIQNDNRLDWNLQSAYEEEQPCYGSHFVGAVAFSSDYETASIQLPLLDLSKGINATLSFKYGYVQRYDWIVDTLRVVATTDCMSAQVVWEKFGTDLSTGTPSEGTNVFPDCDYDETVSIDLSSLLGAEKVSISFVAIGRFYSWIVLDDINITSTINDCEAINLTISDAYSGTISRVAQTAISSTSSIATGGDVSFIAGTSVTLNAGFHAQAGSQFKAAIQACDFPELTEEMLPTQEKISNSLLAEPSLSVYPNPFTFNTTIAYQLPSASTVAIQIFDWTGKRIASIEDNTFKEEGFYQQDFHANKLLSGTYFVSFQCADHFEVRKLIIAK